MDVSLRVMGAQRSAMAAGLVAKLDEKRRSLNPSSRKMKKFGSKRKELKNTSERK